MKLQITFENTGETFSGLYAAQKRCTANGYSYGSTDYTGKFGIKKGQRAIAKFRNLTQEERLELDGYGSGDLREGSVTIYFR